MFKENGTKPPAIFKRRHRHDRPARLRVHQGATAGGLGLPVLFQWERLQVEERMHERCVATGVVPERVVDSVKSPVEPRVLDHMY
ncbi:hypothetical protein PsorP6_016221 [Peronosclerospora sorghi]|uniref:Uncharacterized protein n=1 Tax=Peronosclerospora sorghi TaxID=230839 RepID=A0ACC0VPA0_9STRA|nr:hypothetical protein PsorP6_016221 [Peronosclerospora sorghi]